MTRDAAPPDRHELVSRANIEHVLRAIGDPWPAEPRELVTSTGLSKPTVLSIITALEEEGLIRGISMPTAGVGRTPTFYEHNPGAAHVVGLDLGGTTVTAALANLAGTVLAEIDEETTTAGGDAVVRQLAVMAREVARRGSIGWRSIDAVSVGSPGVITSEGTLDLASNVTGLGVHTAWPRAATAGEQLVNVDNDVNMAALGRAASRRRSEKCQDLRAARDRDRRGSRPRDRRADGTGCARRRRRIAFLPIGGDPTTAEAQ